MSEPEQLVSVGGRRVRLTNLDKVLYPATGTTKGEVIDYYSRIAPHLLPHLRDRPITRIRYPEGTERTSFFAKDLERGAPDWVRRVAIPHSGGPKEYPVADDLATLIYLAQVASLELHVPQWRFTPDGERAGPDRLVLDLDPGPGIGLAECAQVARWAREILRGMGLELYPVTSGSKGIHLYAPLDGSATSEQITALAKELALALETDHPELVVSQMAKVARGGKVFLDWSQNNGSKTTISPYSLRGRAWPTVAAPRTWDELDDPDLDHLLMADVLARIERIGDPIAALGSRAPSAQAVPAIAPDPMLSTPSTPGLARDAAQRWGAWVEMKWDGVRALGLWDGDRLRLRARSGTDITATYPELTGTPVDLGPAPCVIDGEVVALDGAGKPSFSLLQARMHLSSPGEVAREAPRTPVRFFLFDRVSLTGSGLVDEPLRTRRDTLDALASTLPAPFVVPPIFDDVDAALDAASSLALEGIVVKDPASTYRPGIRSDKWLKVKITRTQEVIVGGVRVARDGAPGHFASLLLGIPGAAGLRYVGRVGSGFSERAAAQLSDLLSSRRIDECPFTEVPTADAADAWWVRPDLVAEVEFAEFTPGGILRHARWRGLRSDKRPEDVRDE